MTSKLLFGTDPEMVSVYEIEGKSFALPPYFFRKFLGINASDDLRHPVFLQTDAWKFHEDGAAWEMAIRPSHNSRDLFDTIQECKTAAEQRIISQFPDHCLPVLKFLPTVGFDVERWNKMGEELGEEFWEEFKMSTEFGCDPDRDAFDIQSRGFVEDASQHPYRYCGGHIHISGSKAIAKEPILAVKCLALSAGCAGVLYSDVSNLEKLRTYLYGKPGKFRIQNYGPNNPFGKNYSTGIEYRTLSTRWCSDWKIAEKIFEWVSIGIHNLLEGGLGLELLPDLAPIATRAIIEQDKNLAQEVLSRISSKI